MTEERLFELALQATPDERSALLDRECASDAELRRRIEDLLLADAQPSLTIDSPVGQLDSLAPSPEEVGAVIAGRYTLVELIGEGGMGEVWVAKQSEPVKRKVAIKLIKAGMDSKSVLHRFEAERQALALMDHPNIAKVLDGGMTAERRPFFVMELVNGLPLNRFCDEAKLDVRDRLELFVATCQAVQHAHQKGVIHRDLKPTNILVTILDGKPVAKVIDFGVAKAVGGRLTDESLATQFGAVVGTLEYMSPEQAAFSAADVDTRSDIYSLGVILYELLTGLKPIDSVRFREAAFSEMIRIIKEEEPSKPSTRLSTDASAPSMAALRQSEPKKLATLLRGELDWVVMKCLEKQRDRRYETANGLARDVQRYLVDEPVEARPPSAGYRFKKFVQRNRGRVLAAAALAVLLVLGAIGLVVGIVTVNAERQRTSVALEQEKRARDQALSALQGLTDEIVENQMARGATLTDENKEFLRKIIKHYERFATIAGDDAEARWVRGTGHGRVGTMRNRLGELKEAESAYAEAIAIFQKLFANFPNRPEFRQSLATTHNNRGLLYKMMSRMKEAEADFAEALAILKSLVADFADRPEFRHDLARGYLNFGLVYQDTGRWKEAEVAFSEALAIQKQTAADVPTRPDLLNEFAANLSNASKLYREMGRSKDAENAQAEALAIHKRLALDFPARPEYRVRLALAHSSYGGIFRDTGRLKDAEGPFAEALAILKKVTAEFPGRPDFQRELAAGHSNVGFVFQYTDRLKDAESAHAEALAIQNRLLVDLPDVPAIQNDLAGTLVNLASIANQRRDFEAAKRYLDQAQPHHMAALKANPRHPNFRQFYWSHLINRVTAEAGRKDRSAALAAARTLADVGWSPPDNTYDAACAMANCVRAAKANETEAQPNDDVKFYGDEAMKMLQEAVAKGYKDLENMKEDDSLHPLRARGDFKKLIAQLEAKAAEKP